MTQILFSRRLSRNRETSICKALFSPLKNANATDIVIFNAIFHFSLVVIAEEQIKANDYSLITFCSPKILKRQSQQKRVGGGGIKGNGRR